LGGFTGVLREATATGTLQQDTAANQTNYLPDRVVMPSQYSMIARFQYGVAMNWGVRTNLPQQLGARR
jgi:hypothetical protein